MIEGSVLALAFGAGMVATVNPCGFAMLPAYLSYFLGLDDASPDTGTSLLRALGVSATVSAGFLSVFAVVGVLITEFSLQLDRFLPWMTIVIGVGLVVLGVLMLRGYEPTVSLPKLDKGAGSRQLSSMFLFGVSYAIASLSCTIGVFLTTVSVTFTRRDFVSGVQVFVAYALGMAVVLMALTLGLALARQSIVHHLRKVLPYVHRVAGGFLIVAGAYLTYYGWFELRVNAGDLTAGGLPRMVFDWNSSIANWVQQTGPARIGLVLGALIVAAVILAIGIRATRPPEPSSTSRATDTPEKADHDG